MRTSSQAHREAEGLQTSWHVPSSSAGSLCACSQGEQGQHCPAPAKAARQRPLPRPEAANSHRLMTIPHGASLFSGPLAGMLGAERAMGSLWSPFPAFYPSWGWFIMRRFIPALYQGPKNHLLPDLCEDIEQVISHTEHSWLYAGGIRLQGL